MVRHQEHHDPNLFLQNLRHTIASGTSWSPRAIFHVGRRSNGLWQDSQNPSRGKPCRTYPSVTVGAQLYSRDGDWTPLSPISCGDIHVAHRQITTQNS